MTDVRDWTMTVVVHTTPRAQSVRRSPRTCGEGASATTHYVTRRPRTRGKPGDMAARGSPEDVERLAAGILAHASCAPHVVFSLAHGTSRDGFKSRYRELAKALHPDKAKSKAAEEAFKGARVVGRRGRRLETASAPTSQPHETSTAPRPLQEIVPTYIFSFFLPNLPLLPAVFFSICQRRVTLSPHSSSRALTHRDA